MARWVFRCPECRTRRQDFGLFTQHLKATGHNVCKCSGYHHSHRKGSRYCRHNPASDLYHAARQGADDADLAQIAATLMAEQPETANKVQDACCVLQITTDPKANHGSEIV